MYITCIFWVWTDLSKSPRARALFVKKYDFFDSKSILTSNIYPGTLEKNMRSKNSPPKPEMSAPARAIKENMFEYLFAKFGLSQNKSIMRYIKLEQNLDKEFISEVKIDIGAFWPALY